MPLSRRPSFSSSADFLHSRPHLPGLQRLGARRAGAALLALALALPFALGAAGSALAQAAAKQDREQPLTFDAGQMKIDGKRKVRVLSGGVELVRGGFLLKAAEVEVRETATGQLAVALASAGQPATFRQKREGADETIEGAAERIEYDTRAETVRLVGKAVLRRFRAGVLSEEVSGQTIVYDQERETFDVMGGTAAPGASGGRVKGVVAPR